MTQFLDGLIYMLQTWQGWVFILGLMFVSGLFGYCAERRSQKRAAKVAANAPAQVLITRLLVPNVIPEAAENADKPAIPRDQMEDAARYE